MFAAAFTSSEFVPFHPRFCDVASLCPDVERSETSLLIAGFCLNKCSEILRFAQNDKQRNGANSQARNSFCVAFNGTTNCIPPIVVKIANLPAKRFVVHSDTEFCRGDLSQLLKRNTALAQDRCHFFQVNRRNGDDDSRLRLVEEHCSYVAVRHPL